MQTDPRTRRDEPPPPEPTAQEREEKRILEAHASRRADDAVILDATMKGYVSGLANNNRNPFEYIQAEAWAWQHGFEQGRLHRVRSDVDRYIGTPFESLIQ